MFLYSNTSYWNSINWKCCINIVSNKDKILCFFNLSYLVSFLWNIIVIIVCWQTNNQTWLLKPNPPPPSIFFRCKIFEGVLLAWIEKKYFLGLHTWRAFIMVVTWCNFYTFSFQVSSLHTFLHIFKHVTLKKCFYNLSILTG